MKDANAIPLTLQAIQKYKIEDRVMFGAVDRPINKELQKQKPSSIPLCADVESMMKIAQAYKQGQLNESYPFEHDILGLFLEPNTRAILTSHLVDTIHKTGRPLALVGSLLDDPAVQREMIQLGVDNYFIYSFFYIQFHFFVDNAFGDNKTISCLVSSLLLFTYS